MRISIKHDWGTTLENGLVYYILLGVEGGAAERLHVRVEESVHTALEPGLNEAARGITERFIVVLLDKLVRLGVEGVPGLLTTSNGRPGYFLDLQPGDTRHGQRLTSDKCCQYQAVDNADMFCAAARWPPEQAGAFPITRYRCNTCAMPDGRVDLTPNSRPLQLQPSCDAEQTLPA